jgi:cyanate lyase
MAGPSLDKSDCARMVSEARVARGLKWADLADAIDRPPVWSVAALLGKHPVPAECAQIICEKLDLPEACIAAMQRQPYRTADPVLATDPTVYRFHEAIDVYGEALKELIHDEFGDGIMSAINFNMAFARRPDPHGDRVVVTFDGKFLPYQW